MCRPFYFILIVVMVSSDKNIESIVQLIESLKSWAGVKAEYLKIDAADKGVRILAALIFLVVFLFFVFSISILISIALALAISNFVGMAWSFVIMAFAYLLVFLLLIILKKQWIMNPIVKFFSLILDSEEDYTNA